ncbi:MAG: alginate O-acetyltransferase [Spirochaetaceae bacterium]|nr:MAG: alginate O-acetyltransferase [Spirochaetaceae bacterium]
MRNNTEESRGVRPHGVTYAFGLTMLILLGAGVLLSLMNPVFGPNDSVRRSYGSLLTGDWTHEFQQDYELESPVRDLGLEIWGSLRFGLFREGLPGVVVGEQGVLFTAEEFTALSHAGNEAARARDVAAYVASVAAQLGRLGVELVVVPLPSKARLYRQYLGRYGFPPAAEERYAAFLSALEAAGVDHVGLKEVLAGSRDRGVEVFLRTDTHWTPAGAELAAVAVAEHVNVAGYLENIPTQEFRLEFGEEHRHDGDLLSFIPLGPFRGRLQPAPDLIQSFELYSGPAPGLGLFDTAAVPVVLVGTSYSAGAAWGFDAFLQVELQAEVLNLAEEGRGPFLPMVRYLDSDTLHEAPPRFVIWEIPERYLPHAELPELPSRN